MGSSLLSNICFRHDSIKASFAEADKETAATSWDFDLDGVVQNSGLVQFPAALLPLSPVKRWTLIRNCEQIGLQGTICAQKGQPCK
mmetsp:Transcript_29741/g.60786  ORF Transcript_29741/g.60786 Transcript_29741/m.60786 type:complete len:86 (+) Transcript_29741:522-779(+)